MDDWQQLAIIPVDRAHKYDVEFLESRSFWEDDPSFVERFYIASSGELLVCESIFKEQPIKLGSLREVEMVAVVANVESLRDMFAALTEHTFQVDLGIADTRLTDYLTEMLVRFIRLDAIFRFRNTVGRRLEEVAEMMLEADQRQGKPRREIYRHIGDFTLFWTGIYPEALSHLQSPDRKDHLLDYLEQGKRSYFIASTYDDKPYHDEAPVLRRLSAEFELCSVGLQQVRKEWEKPVGS